jgi:hypothetical protein
MPDELAPSACGSTCSDDSKPAIELFVIQPVTKQAVHTGKYSMANKWRRMHPILS